MKRFLLTLAVLAIAATAFAQQQTYHPVPFQLDNAIWYEYYVDAEAYENKQGKGDWYHYGYFTLDTCDTVINNFKYKQVIAELNGELFNNTTLFIREDTIARRVYLMNRFTERVLYDFSLEVGDTAPHYSFTQQFPIVQSIDTINIGGVLRKVINFSHSNDIDVWFSNGTNYMQELSWIEGIGSTQGFLFPFVESSEYGSFANVLVCYSSNDSIIYHNSHFTDCMPTNTITSPESTPSITAYPNPAKDRITLEFGEARFSTLRLVNTAGATVLETALTGHDPQHTLQLKGLPAGIYSCILSGKDGTATQKIVVE